MCISGGVEIVRQDDCYESRVLNNSIYLLTISLNYYR